MPLVTSGVVGVFSSPKTRSPSIRTASVLVPPTSMPIRVDILSACSAFLIPRHRAIGPNLPSTAEHLVIHIRSCVCADSPGVDLPMINTAAQNEMVGGVGRLLARAGAASETLDRADTEETSVADVVTTVSEELGLPITAR